MIRRMQWILLTGVLLAIAPEMPPAQEKAPQDQQAQSVEQPKGYDDLQQKMLYEKQQSDMEIQRMEARKKNEKYYNTLAFISFAITVLVVFAIIALIFLLVPVERNGGTNLSDSTSKKAGMCRVSCCREK